MRFRRPIPGTAEDWLSRAKGDLALAKVPLPEGGYSELISGLEKEGIPLPQDVKDAEVLTSYAWEARYPGLYEPVTEEEYREAVGLAEAVLAWAETRMGG